MNHWTVLRRYLSSLARSFSASLKLARHSGGEQLHLQLGDLQRVPVSDSKKTRPASARRFSR